MKISFKIFWGLGMLFICFSGFSQSLEKEVPPSYTESSFLGRLKSFFRDGELKSLVLVNEGYDNNVWLDSRREGDVYTQVIFRPRFTSPISEKIRGILDYELMSLVYMDESNANLIINTLGFGGEFDINDELKFSKSYHFSLTEYPNSGNDDFYDNSLELKLTHKLPQKMFHSLGYEFLFRNYQERKIRLSPINYSDKEREDKRHSVDYEIGKYFSKDLFKIKFQYYNNNSNDSYLKYYDYDSYKIGVSLTHIFNDRFFSHTSFSRQWRDFSGRTISTDPSTKEWDRTYLVIVGLYYKFNKDLTLGVSYTYRENWSNESIENYSGSLIALNTSYRF
ncbi:MAG: outer membrane beta-barrel protein [Candidatus Omnitrophica bacterium]|nr:outer membrane beta-barrel protein [Candidatus Omnitrophota bacterium]